MKWYKQFPDNHPAIKPALDAFGWEGKGIMDKLTQLAQESGPFALDISVLQRNFGFNARKATRIFPIISECFAEVCKLIPELRSNDRPSINEWITLRQFVFKRDNFTCQYCGSRGGKLECDHIVPVSKGGSHEIWNLTTACFKCNRAKGSKLLKEWRR